MIKCKYVLLNPKTKSHFKTNSHVIGNNIVRYRSLDFLYCFKGLE